MCGGIGRRRGAITATKGRCGTMWRAACERRGVRRRRSRLVDGYGTPSERTRAYRETLFPPEDCAGIVVATVGKPIGIDLFDSPLTLHRLWPRLADSYFMEAAQGDAACDAPEDAAAKAFIEEIAAGLEIVQPPLGAGTELEVNQDGLTGAGVYYRGRAVHLAAFAT